MFSDSNTSSSGFTSNWKFSRDSQDSSVQTSEVLLSSIDVETKEYNQVEIQTEENEMVSANGALYDENQLALFLQRICPAVITELDRASCSNAFASYLLLTDDETDVRQLASLPPIHNKSDIQMKVSSLSWSCTGSVLALARSHTLHNSWCSHQGEVTLYNIDRERRSGVTTLRAPSCVRSVSMHPYLSSIVAAGTYSGDVLLWDTARDGSDMCLVSSSRSAHNDSVTQLCWALGTDTAVFLVSSALDGKVIFWKVSPKLSTYQVIDRFAFDLSSITAGVICFTFPYHKPDTFVVALEGGTLCHCSTTAAKPIVSVAGGAGEVVKDPVVSRFEPQPASVVCVEFSPHQNHLFATASTDQAIRIYSLFKSTPQRVIWHSVNLAGVAWSPSQASMLASWGSSGAVAIYNAGSGDLVITLSPHEETACKTHLSVAAFNAKSPRLLGVGDLDGSVYIWEIPVYISDKPKQ